MSHLLNKIQIIYSELTKTLYLVRVTEGGTVIDKRVITDTEIKLLKAVLPLIND